MYFKSGLLVWLFPVLLAVLSSCSVKEDRSGCPCRLTVAVSDLPVTPVEVVVSGEEFRDIRQAERDTVLMMPVPRPSVRLRAVHGAPADAGDILIPYGFQCPPLYLFDAEIDTSGETAFCQVGLRKSFCTLTVVFSGPPGWETPYSLEILGTVDGYLEGGLLSEGAFACRISGAGTVRLPRQRDDSLRMDVLLQDNKVRTFALGAYIAASGYDWTLPDLQDLTLEIDLSVTQITFRIGLWTESVPLEIVI